MTEQTSSGDTSVETPSNAALAMPEIEPAKVINEITEADLEKEFGQVSSPAPETSDDAGTDGSAEPEAKGETLEKPKSDVQSRIDEITSARREAERREAEARREVEYWRGQVEKAAPKPVGEQTVDPESEPAPDNYEFGEADAKFIADTARYHARQEFAAQQREAQIRAEFASLEVGWQANTAKVADVYPDFQQKVVDTANRGEWACSPLVALGIKASPFGPDVAYHLASDPAEAKRIASLTDIEQAREFGRLEARFEARAAAKNTPPKLATTSAPPPPSGQARGVGGRFAVAADTDDFSSFERSADAILARK